MRVRSIIIKSQGRDSNKPVFTFYLSVILKVPSNSGIVLFLWYSDEILSIGGLKVLSLLPHKEPSYSSYFHTTFMV